MSDELDFTKPETLQLRGGGEFRIYATDGAGRYPIHGACKAEGEGWCTRIWTRSGRYSLAQESTRDLIRKPVRVQGWINYYGLNEKLLFLYGSQPAAKLHQSAGCLGQIYIDAELQS